MFGGTEHFENIEKSQDKYKHTLENLDNKSELDHERVLEEFNLSLDEARIVFETLPPVEQEEFIEEYRCYLDATKGYKPSRLEIFVRVLQYISPEWRRKTDEMVREYMLRSENSLSLLNVKKEKDERCYIRHLRTFIEEGYSGYIALVLKHTGNTPKAKTVCEKYSEFINRKVFTINEEFEQKSFQEIEKLVQDNAYGKSLQYLTGFKNSDYEKYKQKIKTLGKQLYLALALKKHFQYEGIDCNEQTVMNQDLAYRLNMQIGIYADIPGHVAIEMPGTGLVLDTYDRQLRTKGEFIEKAGYEADSYEAKIKEKKYYITSREYLREDQYGAMEELPRIRRPNTTDEKLAHLFIDRGVANAFLKKQIYWWKFITKIDSENAQAYKMLGMALKSKLETSSSYRKQTIEVYEKVSTLEPENEHAYLSLGKLYLGAKKYEKSEEALKIGLSINPKNTMIVAVLQDLYNKTNNINGAIDLYLLQYKLHDKSSDFELSGLVKFLETRGKQRKLIRIIEGLVKNPSHIGAMKLLQKIYKKKGYEKGIIRSHVMLYLSGDKNEKDELGRLGEFLKEKGKTGKFTRILKKLIRKHKKAPEAHYELGLIYYEKGRYSKAIDQFYDFEDEGGDENEVAYYVTMAFSSLGNIDIAIERIEERMSKNPKNFVEDFSTLVEVYKESRRSKKWKNTYIVQDLFEEYENKIKQNPKKYEPNIALAILHKEEKNLKKSKEYAEKALEIKPDNEDAKAMIAAADMLINLEK